MFFNGLIRSHSITYINLSVSFSVAAYMNLNSKDPLDYKHLGGLVVLGIWPFIATYVLKRNEKTLDTPGTRGKIERMYQEIDLTRSTWTIYYYPLFCARRFLFVFIPIFYPDYPIIQVLCLIMMNLLFVLFLGSVRPKKKKKKRLLEFFNEWMILFISVHMLCFTNFVLSPQLYFYIGYNFVGMMGLVFIVNIGNMIHSNILKFKLKQKKKRV